MNTDINDIIKNGLGGLVTVLLVGVFVFLYGVINNSLDNIITFINEKRFSLVETVLIIVIAYPIIIFAAKKIISILRFSSKEIVGGQLNQGEFIQLKTKAGKQIKIQLDDITPNEGILRISKAIISILDENDNILDRFKIPQDTNKIVNVSGEEIKLRVGEITAGYTFGAKWAELSILE
jgi:hypothetical protein